MKYKTLYYDVTPIAHKLPDDCLQIIIKYAHDESKYNAIKSIPRTVELFGDDGLWLQSNVTLHALYRIRHIKDIFGYYYGVEWFKKNQVEHHHIIIDTIIDTIKLNYVVKYFTKHLNTIYKKLIGIYVVLIYCT